MALDWRNPSYGTTANDLTFTSEKTGRRLLINTVNILSDGRTPVRREREAANRTVHNGEPGDVVILLPILDEGHSLDDARLEAVLGPLLAEIDNPPPKDDPRDSTPLDQLWQLGEEGV